MQSRTIHIEGLDLAGKSTVCRKLVEKLGARKRHNSLAEPNPIQIRAEALQKADCLSPSTLGGVFFGSLLYDLEHFEEDGVPTVQDSSTILRSIAYHSVAGDKALAEEFRKLLPVYPRFAITCVISASREVRLKRLEGRISRGNDMAEDYFVRDNYDLFKRMEDVLTETAVEHFGAVCIDTSTLEMDGEKDRIADFIIRQANALIGDERA